MARTMTWAINGRRWRRGCGRRCGGGLEDGGGRRRTQSQWEERWKRRTRKGMRNSVGIFQTDNAIAFCRPFLGGPVPCPPALPDLETSNRHTVSSPASAQRTAIPSRSSINQHLFRNCRRSLQLQLKPQEDVQLFVSLVLP